MTVDYSHAALLNVTAPKGRNAETSNYWKDPFVSPGGCENLFILHLLKGGFLFSFSGKNLSGVTRADLCKSTTAESDVFFGSGSQQAESIYLNKNPSSC